jgi:Domain of unknown function (DUF5658)
VHLPRRLTFTLDGFSEARPQFVIFLYLQLLDFLTTVVALKFGFAESSPFIRWLMHSNMTVGLAESKLVGVGLAAMCIFFDRAYLVRWINRWYAVLVIWNLGLMWFATPR